LTVIDVHTHMLTRGYLALIDQKGDPPYDVGESPTGEKVIRMHGAPFFTITEPMWDYDRRIADMDAARVDIAVVSLTCPNAYFGDAQTSQTAARIVNDSMAEQQTLRPDRIRWLASLPWQYERLALEELERAMALGAIGVMVIANISGASLIEPRFAAIWRAIDERRLPVLVHPGAPQGIQGMGMDRFGLVPPVGFTFDTTLAFSKLILSGFLDRHPNIRLIASHGGGTLPYLSARLDRCHEVLAAASELISIRPSEYLRRIYYDAVVYSRDALELCIKVAGTDRHVLYGSDYPHNIGDMRGCLERVDSLPAKSALRIRGENARELFGL
jgi:aminocarboxymuconate-semialdehyde decarboxylase